MIDTTNPTTYNNLPNDLKEGMVEEEQPTAEQKKEQDRSDDTFKELIHYEEGHRKLILGSCCQSINELAGLFIWLRKELSWDNNTTNRGSSYTG